MLQYNELGRHTPPPPPYSLSKRDPTKIPSANQPPAPPPPPPPPPPYLSSTRKCNFTIPAIDNLRPQRIPPEIPSSSACHHSNPALLPPVGLERGARQVASNAPQQTIEDYPRTWKKNWRSAGVSAHPVEPKWTPAGIPGLPGPLSGSGATVPSPQFPLERLGHSAPREFFFSADTRVGPSCRNATSACSNTLSMGHSCAACSAQPPIRVVPMPGAIKDAKPIHPFRKQSGKDIASLANIITAPPLGANGPTERLCPASAIPSPLVPLPKSEGPDPSEKTLDVKNAPHHFSDSSNHVDLSDSEDNSAHSASVSKTRNPGCLALIPPDGIQLSKDRKTRFPGHDRSERVSRSVNRKALFSSRYEPYRRRRSSVAEVVKRRVGSGIDGGCGKAMGVQRELVMNDEEEDGEEGESVGGKGGNGVE